jgi:hypothetical protein
LAVGAVKEGDDVAVVLSPAVIRINILKMAAGLRKGIVAEPIGSDA